MSIPDVLPQRTPVANDRNLTRLKGLSFSLQFPPPCITACVPDTGETLSLSLRRRILALSSSSLSNCTRAVMNCSVILSTASHPE